MEEESSFTIFQDSKCILWGKYKVASNLLKS